MASDKRNSPGDDGGEPYGRPLRHRVLVAMVGVATLAVALFAIPLAVSMQRRYHDETAAALGRDATWIAAVVPDDVVRSSVTSTWLPKGLPSRLVVGFYAADGTKISGGGPSRSDVAADARDGHVHEAVENGFLAVAAPIPSDERLTGSVRVATPYQAVRDRVHRAWLAMAGLAVVVVGLAAGFALRHSARLAAPLEHLTMSAQALGSGDFSIRALRSDVREANAAGLALEATARRLGDMLDRERAFSADVSHQLRTQLTGMLLGLESALGRPDADLPGAIRTAVARGERLQTIIEDLVRLSRGSRTSGAEPLDVRALLEEVTGDRRATLAEDGRRLTVSLPEEPPEVEASPAAVRQILHVLLDNAAIHGKGGIAVEVSDLGDGVAIEVTDQGDGIPEGADVFARRSGDAKGHGIGLALARSLAEAEGGRLILRRPAPPVFSLLLPTR
ncbi:HAMP domain-containing histidine kinase [Planotetraspora sp. A-T 1434]|uniref:sensor histidine kinase n=1 Tax=Planotetraspora sp. A-T 1434 TaxID=2979219 RepID=UPI0021C23261|nr:HAMP domain-containing sensor histidine kinase [Planotetraspora sp. A-T 1434]MCT9929712.1 HAMP domain-containing histidine kinase [Planotetraspora sp. A-T 1434]